MATIYCSSCQADVISSVADPDPGSGIGCLFDLWIRDLESGMGKKSGSGSGMNNPYHIFWSLETIFLG